MNNLEKLHALATLTFISFHSSSPIFWSFFVFSNNTLLTLCLIKRSFIKGKLFMPFNFSTLYLCNCARYIYCNLQSEYRTLAFISLIVQKATITINKTKHSYILLYRRENACDDNLMMNMQPHQ
jgi:hypothetical protein